MLLTKVARATTKRDCLIRRRIDRETHNQRGCSMSKHDATMRPADWFEWRLRGLQRKYSNAMDEIGSKLE